MSNYSPAPSVCSCPENVGGLCHKQADTGDHKTASADTPPDTQTVTRPGDMALPARGRSWARFFSPDVNTRHAFHTCDLRSISADIAHTRFGTALCI